MRILIIEDNDDHFDLIEDTIDDMEIDTKVCREVTMQQGMSTLKGGIFDVCLLDLVLPDSTLDESITMMGSIKVATPIVALTSIKDMYVAEKLMNHGVQDYLPKDELTPFSLYRTCLYAIERQQYLIKIDRQNKDMQAFCASLSHDFLSSINRIRQVSSLLASGLLERIGLTEEDNHWFDILNRSAEDTRRLVAGLTQYLSIDSRTEQNEVVEINDLINSVEHSLRETTDGDFELQFENAILNVSGYSPLLFILFQNLISNGIKYSDGVAKIVVKYEQNDSTVVIKFTDSGIGFDSKEAQHIFEPFSRLNTERGGSGLGLSICLRIIELHNGKIHAESVPGRGSTFFVELPLF